MISHLSILVFLAQSIGFRDMLFEELEPLLKVVEVRQLEPGPLTSELNGHSLVYKGRLQRLGGNPLTQGELLTHGKTEETLAVLEPSILLYFPNSGMEGLLRNEPELGMLLLEQLRGEKVS